MAKTARPSPTESASEFEVGVTRTGNDGNTYVVAADKNGRHRWAKHQLKAAEPEPEPVLESEPEPEEAPKAKRAPKKAAAPWGAQLSDALRKLPVPIPDATYVQEKPAKPEQKKAPKASKKPAAVPVPIPEPEPVSDSESEEEKPKKVHTRKAPAEPAKNFDEGYELEGEDGKMHVVMVTKAGVKRWVHKH